MLDMEKKQLSMEETKTRDDGNSSQGSASTLSQTDNTANSVSTDQLHVDQIDSHKAFCAICNEAGIQLSSFPCIHKASELVNSNSAKESSVFSGQQRQNELSSLVSLSKICSDLFEQVIQDPNQQEN